MAWARGGRTAWGLALALALGGCAHRPAPRRFADAPPVWVDDDREAFSPPPAAFYSPYFWDAMDHAFFRKLAEVWTLERPRPAANVNALDEVPDSSWFTNRIGMLPVTPAEAALGPCDPLEDPVPTPWRVVAGKPDGLNPGFTIVDAAGVRHLVKTDGAAQPDRATAADVIGALVHHAAGYHVPCNRVVYFRAGDLSLDPDARVRRTNGSVEPMTPDHVDEVLDAATRLPDGWLRASASRFVEGRVLGPWRYWGTEPADPNDVFDHRDRRELRGLYVLSAWLDHVDARQENTLRTWVARTPDGPGHVRHWIIDFGDCLGLLSHIPGLSPRLGHSGYFDVEHVLGDVATLGLLDRPWHRARPSEAGITLAYFDAERFDADGWRSGYPNPAYEARREADAAWMARILARIGPAHVRAIVDRGRLDWTSRRVATEVLLGRRRKLLERYLTRLSPLTDPTIDPDGPGGPWLCVEDRAVTGGIRRRADRRYGARVWRDGGAVDVAPRLRAPAPARVCLPLGDALGAPADPYVVADVYVAGPGDRGPAPLRVHLRIDGSPRVVGLERPEAG